MLTAVAAPRASVIRLACAAVTVVAALSLAGCAGGARVRAVTTATSSTGTGVGADSTAVAPSTPAASRSAQDVVATYLTAVTTGDGATARAMSTSRFAAGDSWQHGRAPLSATAHGPVSAYDTSYGQDWIRAYEQAVNVQVTYTVSGWDRGVRPGVPNTTGVVVVRHDDTQPWLIAEMGNG